MYIVLSTKIQQEKEVPKPSSQLTAGPKQDEYPQILPAPEPVDSHAHSDLLARLSRLEYEWATERSRNSMSQQGGDQAPESATRIPLSKVTEIRDSDLDMPEHDHAQAMSLTDGESSQTQSQSCFEAPLEQNTAACSLGDPISVATEHRVPVPCSFSDRENLPECCSLDLQLWSRYSSQDDEAEVRAQLKKFFEYLNPHCRSSDKTCWRR